MRQNANCDGRHRLLLRLVLIRPNQNKTKKERKNTHNKESTADHVLSAALLLCCSALSLCPSVRVSISVSVSVSARPIDQSLVPSLLFSQNFLHP